MKSILTAIALLFFGAALTATSHACTPSSSPTYEVLYSVTAGTREILAVQFSGGAAGCRLQISNLDATLVGKPTTDEITTFGAWATSDSSCGEGNLTATPTLAGVLGVNQYKISDQFKTAAGGVILPNPGTGNVICLGFYDTYSDWYEAFNFTLSYVN